MGDTTPIPLCYHSYFPKFLMWHKLCVYKASRKNQISRNFESSGSASGIAFEGLIPANPMCLT